ncbi:MAG: hypothetical protein AAF532_00415 [Planctomycetota bacterium]
MKIIPLRCRQVLDVCERVLVFFGPIDALATPRRVIRDKQIKQGFVRVRRVFLGRGVLTVRSVGDVFSMAPGVPLILVLIFPANIVYNHDV